MEIYQSITSKSNPRIVRVAKYTDKKYRDQDGVFVCEGLKLFEEAVLAGADIREIYVDEEAYSRWPEQVHARIRSCDGAERFCIPKEIFRKLTAESAPQGILAVVKCLPSVRTVDTSKPEAGETVMLFESIRDPGNLGTLIRTAAAFGFDRLILSKDCTDVFNPKVIRAAMGAIFKVKIDYCRDFVSTVKHLGNSGRRTLAALPRERAVVAGRDPLRADDCIVIGNEGHGLSDETIDACTDAIYIPMEENTESLNAAIASSVLMWEIAKSK